GTFFGTPENRFYTAASPWGEQLAAELRAADSEPDEAKRNRMYQEINRKLLSEYLPAIPLTHSPPAIVTSPEVQGLQPSPLTAEEFATVTVQRCPGHGSRGRAGTSRAPPPGIDGGLVLRYAIRRLAQLVLVVVVLSMLLFAWLR